MSGIYEKGDKVVVREEVLANAGESAKMFYAGKVLTVIYSNNGWIEFTPGINGPSSSTNVKHIKPA